MNLHIFSMHFDRLGYLVRSPKVSSKLFEKLGNQIGCREIEMGLKGKWGNDLLSKEFHNLRDKDKATGNEPKRKEEEGEPIIDVSEASN